MNVYEKLEYYGKQRDWYSVGEGGFYEHERRTRLLCKNKEQKGYGEFKQSQESKEFEVILHNNSKYGYNVKGGKAEFKRIASIPSHRIAYNKISWDKAHPKSKCVGCMLANTANCNNCNK